MVNEIKAKLFQLKLHRATVVLPDVGELTVQEITGAQREKFESMVLNKRREAENAKRDLDLSGSKALLVQMSVIDPETGELMFGLEDLAKLGVLPSRTLESLFSASQDVSGIGRDEEQKVEEN